MSEETKVETSGHDSRDEHHEDHKHGHGHGADYAAGPLWLIGWLFTIGFIHPSFWKAVLAIIIWPYYLGNVLRP